MILWLIVALTLITGGCWFFVTQRWGRLILGTLATLALTAAVAALAANMQNHFGMHEVTTTQVTPVYSASPAQSPVQTLAAKKIGPNNAVLVYKDTPTQAQPTAHFTPDKNHIQAAIHQQATYAYGDDDTAKLTTKTTRWVYDSDFMKMLFEQHDDDTPNTVHHHVTVPHTWKIVTQ